MKKLVAMMMRCCGIDEEHIVHLNPKNGMDQQEVERLAGQPAKVRALWIYGLCQDPVRLFWLCVKHGLLADGCRVVFTSAVPGPSWGDLDSVYRGQLFGTLYIMTYREGRVPTMPSQRGLFHS